MTQWLALLPHIIKVMGLILGKGRAFFCLEFACSKYGFVGLGVSGFPSPLKTCTVSWVNSLICAFGPMH